MYFTFLSSPLPLKLIYFIVLCEINNSVSRLLKEEHLEQIVRILKKRFSIFCLKVTYVCPQKVKNKKLIPGTHCPLTCHLSELQCGKERCPWRLLSLKEAQNYISYHKDTAPSFRHLLFHKNTFEQWKTSVMICSFTHQQLSCHSLFQEETCLQKDSP